MLTLKTIDKLRKALKDWAYNHKHYGTWVLLMTQEEKKDGDQARNS